MRCVRGLLAVCVFGLGLTGASAQGAELLGERQFSLVGSNGTNASPPVGVELLLRITDASLGDGPVLFEGIEWTPADAGRTVTLMSADDADFDAAAAALSDGQLNYLNFMLEILPDLGGPGFAQTEAQFFGLGGGEVDLFGASVESIALRLDALQLPPEGSGSNEVDATLTLSIYGSLAETFCSDQDADGFGAPGDASCPLGSETDCDDFDSAVFPGAAELCDGRDNDCDAAPAWDEHDSDADGLAPCEGDCDDADAAIHPGAVELPGNAVDENCDGSLGACDPAAFDNHGQFLRCVAAEVEALVESGGLSEPEGDALVRAAAQSDVGR